MKLFRDKDGILIIPTFNELILLQENNSNEEIFKIKLIYHTYQNGYWHDGETLESGIPYYTGKVEIFINDILLDIVSPLAQFDEGEYIERILEILFDHFKLDDEDRKSVV